MLQNSGSSAADLNAWIMRGFCVAATEVGWIVATAERRYVHGTEYGSAQHVLKKGGRPMQPTATKADWLDKRRAAEHLCISQRTLDRLTKAGRIRAGRLGARVIFRVADLDEAAMAGGTKPENSEC